jgi:ABC-2 type transport system ATP-binding protein
MKQKLGLMCALIHKPKVLFLDEPTNGVDPVSRRDFWRILYQLVREKVTIFFSTAYLDEAERCTRLGLIHQGKLLACGHPAEVKKIMKGTILEVRTNEPRKTMMIFRERFGKNAVAMFGDRTHVRVSDAEESESEIRNLLQSQQIEIFGLKPIEPTLEDVFVSVLTENEGKRDE